MKILVVSNKAETLVDIRGILDGNVHGAEMVFRRRLGEKFPLGETDAEFPDLLILDSSCHNRDDLNAIEALTRRKPHLAVLLLCANPSSDALMDAMRAGVREVLPAPVAKQELLDAVDRAQRHLAVETTGKPRGKVLAFVSGKSGSGATFLATNLGYALAAEYQRKVLLIDLDLQYGDASFFVTEREAMTTVAEVAKEIERLDARFLAASTIEILPTYSLLAAPQDAERAAGIGPEHIEHLVGIALENYDFVILDLERSMDAVSMKALDLADMIFPVVQPMVPHIRDTKNMLRAFRMLAYPDSKIHVIANRSEKELDIPLKLVEKTLGMGIYWTVPNDFKNASASGNQGVPIVKLAPQSPVSHALMELAGDLAGAPKKSHASWLGRLFEHRDQPTV